MKDLLVISASKFNQQTQTYVRILCPIIAMLVLSLTGCKSPSGSDFDSAGTTAPDAAGPIRLHEGDVIRIAFEADTNMNAIAKIQLEGNINLPLAGDVKAAGKTLEELKADLMSRYERLLKVNEITVTLISSSASVTVSGAVLKPGRIPMERPLTALDAILEAGGYDPNRAKMTEVRVLRVENSQQKLYVLNLKRTIQGRDASTFYLKPFDNVHVPEKRFNF